MFKKNSFIYYTHIKVKVNNNDKPINKELIQIFFAHRKQLEAAQRFIADWLIIIDGIFNINKLDLPLFVIVGVLSTGQTFPVAFSYCPAESTKSISFVQDYLKQEYFTGDIPLPRIILGDQAADLISSVPEAFPNSQYQGYN